MAVTGKKISEFSAGALPLAGTEVVPILQSGNKRVTAQDVANLAASAPSIQALSPEYAYYKRVLADSGVIKDLEELTKLYLNDLELDKSTLFKWSGWSGVKTRTSGSNVFVTKAYDNSINNNDAVQATEANQPFYAGNIAPNEVGKIKNLIDNKVLSHPTINLSSSTGFSYTWALKPFFTKISTGGATGKLTGGSIQMFYTNAGTFYMYNATTGSITWDNIPNKLNSKTRLITLTCDGGGIRLWVDGIAYAPTTGALTAFTGTVDSVLNTGSDDTFAGEILHAQIFNKALSAYEVQQHHTYLRSIYPEIEGVAIGNQYIATSNYEGVVAGDGSVIGEYQYTAANSPENVVNGGFTSPITEWTIFGESTISGGSARIYSSVGVNSYIYQNFASVIGKYYKVSFEITNVTLGAISLSDSYNYNSLSQVTYNTVGVKTVYLQAKNTGIVIKRDGTAPCDITIDNVSVKQVGWDEMQAVYDAVYAAASGTAAVKDLAATKAAAMWCYYNNDPLNGAIYGKLYNWWAVKLISIYPPKGWRVPSSADFTQLQTYLGGASVAGGKIKMTGTAYWYPTNTGATNESGLTFIAGGFRENSGAFAGLGTSALTYTSTEFDSTSAIGAYPVPDAATLVINQHSKIRGCAIRMMRNEPVGNAEETISQTIIANTDYASTGLQTAMKFGYRVSLIRIYSEQALTSVEVKLHNSAGTAVATLITGKSVAAGATMVFPVLADYATLLNDGTLRMTAVGNVGSTVGGILQATIQKEIFN